MYKDIVVPLYIVEIYRENSWCQKQKGHRNLLPFVRLEPSSSEAVIDLARLASLSVSSIITFPVKSVVVVRYLESFRRPGEC